MRQTFLADRVDPRELENETVNAVETAIQSWAGTATVSGELDRVIRNAVHHTFEESLVLTELTAPVACENIYAGIFPGEF